MGFVFFLDLNLFLSLDSLMKSVGISSSVEHTTRKLVYNQNFAVGGNDILLSVVEQLVSLQCLLNVVVKLCIFYIAEVFNTEKAFCLFRAVFGNGYRLILSVDNVVPVFHFLQDGGKAVLRGLLFFGELFLSA